MNLRKRLIYLLAAYALVVVVAATVAIYGTLLHVEDALLSFNLSKNVTDEVSRLRVSAREEVLALRSIIERRGEITASYLANHEEFFRQLEHVEQVSPELGRSPVWREVLGIAGMMRAETDACIALVQTGRYEEADRLLVKRLEGDLVESLIRQLYAAGGVVGETSHESVRDVVATNTEVLTLAVVVGLLAIVLLFGGGSLIRHWLIQPITRLREATEQYSQGNLDYRVTVPREGDELGSLAAAMNTMAASLNQARRELHTSEAKYRDLFENLRDAVVICDAQGRVVECHDGDTHILGDDGPNTAGRHLLEAWPEWATENRDWSSLIERVITTGQRFSVPDVVLRGAPGDESQVIADVIAYPVEYGAARYAAIVLRDVTERERLQRLVRHADKMEATGTLAGGIAHDFNNLLTSAIGTLTLLGSEIKDERQADLSQAALRACWQAAGLSRRLLNFASGGYKRPQVLRMAEVADQVVHSLDDSVLEGIRLVTDYEDGVLAKVDKDQLTQIVLNLVRNACDAMPDGGELRIGVNATSMPHPEEKTASRQWAVLTVADTGSGMTQEVKERLFEPFFTTKTRASHKGRGLGLAIVYAAVKNAGGFIHVDSQLNAGTTFRVHLPIGEGVPEPIAPPAYVAPAMPGQGTILVVDDEPMITQMCETALEKWGYSVISADSIADAAQKFDAAEGGISLALIDINLPDGSGVLLAEDLVSIAPDLKIVFATGYAEAIVPDSLDKNVRGRLAKPFALDELVSTLSSSLSPPTPGKDATSARDSAGASAER